MTDMGEGFDKLASRITQIKKDSSEIEESFKKAASYAVEMYRGGGGAGAGGGHAALGSGKNVMGNSFGSNSDIGGEGGAKKAKNRNPFGKDDPRSARMASYGFDTGIGGYVTGKAQMSTGRINSGINRTANILSAFGEPGAAMAEKLLNANAKRLAGMETGRFGRYNAENWGNAQNFVNNQGRTMGMAARGIRASTFDTMNPTQQSNIMNSSYGIGDSLSLISGLSTGFNTMMPKMQETMDRVSSYYNASVAQGQMDRKKLESMTYGTLSKMSGLTSIGSDARVASYLCSRGMSANSAAYQETLRTVGNAGRYLNISNENAAASVEGLTNASGAGSMLQNFGIYTSDLKTGKEKTQTQIFGELAERLTAGRGQASVEQTQASIRRGALGVTADNFFKDSTTNTMFKQFMVDRAAGKPMDMSGGKLNTDNPLNAQMALDTSNTANLAAAQDNYIKGINQASKVLQGLNAVVQGLASTMAGAGSAMSQTIFGADSVKGMTNMAGTTVNFLGKAGSGIANAFQNMDVTFGYTAAPAVTEMGIIAGSAALSLGVAAGSIAGVSAVAGFGGTSKGFSIGNGGGVGGSSGSFAGGGGVGGASNALFSMTNLTSHKLNRGTTGGHKGYDYAYHYGDPVYCIGDGIVQKRVSNHNKQDQATSLNDVSGSLGNYVVVQHNTSSGESFTSTYGHLSSVSAPQEGKYIAKGQEIGKGGNTGGTWPMEVKPGDGNGSHLHFELHKGTKGADKTNENSLDPTDYMTADAAGEDPRTANAYGQNAAGLVQGLNTTEGGTAAVQGQYTAQNTGATNDASNATAAIAQAKGIAGSLPSTDKAMAMLSSLYSNDPTKITAGAQALMSSYGMTDAQQAYFMSGSGDQYTPTSGMPGGSVALPGRSGGSQPVTINVQVPDVTAADAVKFAQLVKGYLDDNSLISNTGRN